jgi:vancomycin resistance protein YoaR
MRHQRLRQSRQHGRFGMPTLSRRTLLIGTVILLGLFIVVNVALWTVYRNRTYPQTRIVDTSIGSVAYSDLATAANDLKLLPSSVTISYDDQKVAVSLQDLGVKKDIERSAKSADKQRSIVPIINLFKSPQLQAPISIDKKAFDKKSVELAKTLHADPSNARLQLTGTTVAIVAEKNGFSLKQNKLEAAVYSALDNGKVAIRAPVTLEAPKVKTSSLQDDQKSLQQQLKTTVTFKFGDKTKQAKAEDIAKWYVQAGDTYDVSANMLRAYIVGVGSEFGIRVKDADQATTVTTSAVKNNKAITITLSEQVAAKTFSYCTAVRGVSTDNLPTLRTMLTSTYADARGWSIGGLVAFKEVSSGCDYTVWLSSAAQMPSFGGVCDSEWSCRSGNNVVINYERWANASPAWNQMGGTISNYRNMVINHETGHWLGFAHDHCGGAGQLAPVMQQQSINLQGCTFNPWPLAREINVLRARLGL